MENRISLSEPGSQLRNKFTTEIGMVSLYFDLLTSYKNIRSLLKTFVNISRNYLYKYLVSQIKVFKTYSNIHWPSFLLLQPFLYLQSVKLTPFLLKLKRNDVGEAEKKKKKKENRHFAGMQDRGRIKGPLQPQAILLKISLSCVVASRWYQLSVSDLG